MTHPDLIIFDCDGVLIDSEVLSCRCLSEVLAGYGINLGSGARPVPWAKHDGGP
jgi:beta-phosphoglucomutase-like phosphatase (HAD superfamily)